MNLSQTYIFSNVEKESTQRNDTALNKPHTGKSVTELLDNLGINDLWDNGYFGEDVTVAIIDSGAYKHEDYSSRIIHFEDLVNGRSEIYDDYGHGTELAGIIAGDGKASNGRNKGVAPKSNLVIIKAIDENGVSDVNVIEKGLNWILENRTRYNIKVLCLSFEYGTFEDYSKDPLYETITTLVDNNVLVVAAAGNTGTSSNQVTSPGLIPDVLAVGSVEMSTVNQEVNYTLAPFSPFVISTNEDKKKPDILAPGVDLITTNLIEREGSDSAQYVVVSGTSYSAAILCGISAALFQKYNSLDARAMAELIKNSTTETNIIKISK